MNTNRRNFLSFMSLGTAGVLGRGFKSYDPKTDFKYVPGKSIFQVGMPGTYIPGSTGNNPREVKLNVKIVYYAMIHSGVWQGPCRFRGDETGPEEEIVQAKKSFENYVRNFKKNLSPHARMLEPVLFEFPESKKITRQDLLKLEADKDEVDLYVVPYTQLSGYLSSIIGEIYKKPVANIRQSAAYLKSRGLEGYVASNYGGTNKLIELLRARKVFQQTNMLLITDVGIPGYPTPGSVSDFEDLKNRFGIGTTIIGINELVEERQRLMNNNNHMNEVESYTDDLISKAKKVNDIGKEQLMGDVLMFFAIKSLMKKYHCNAFSIECFEFCGTRNPDKWQANPCLTHSLLRDEGFPSACEGDTSALLTLSAFMALANNSAFMGNLDGTKKGRTRSFHACDGSIRVSEDWVDGADTEGLKILFGHDVPGLKMLGYDKPDLPYEIRNFVCANPGWGAQLKIDFTKIKEKTVTIGRFDPLAKKIVVTRGEVIGMRGFDNFGCSTRVILDMKDPQGYLRKASDYGHHYVMVYGDHIADLKNLAEILQIELDLHQV